MKVRLKTFETNSSSSHSLVISKSPQRDQKIDVDIFEIIPGEYGWEFETYYTPQEKASYILTDAMNNVKLFVGGKREINKAIKALKNYLNKPVIFKKVSDDEYYQWGYVDHQSSVCEGETMNGIFDKQPNGRYTFDIERFIDFVFSSDCYFRTGNDNA